MSWNFQIQYSYLLIWQQWKQHEKETHLYQESTRSAITCREQVTFRRDDDDDVRFLLDKHTRISWVNSLNRPLIHVSLLWYIFLNSKQTLYLTTVKTAWKGNTSVLLIWSDHFDCAMVNVLDSSAVDSGFDQGLGKTKRTSLASQLSIYEWVREWINEWVNEWLGEWVSDHCLTPREHPFSYNMQRTSYISKRWWWWCPFSTWPLEWR
jgi:hypothetical protein